MKSDKKDLAIIILSVLVGASLISIYLLQLPSGSIPPTYPPNYAVVIGYDHNPQALDPVNTWDKTSTEIQRQITQSLVEYDLSTPPSYQLKPVLAESWIWENNTRISFKIRENVYFHDGTRMTAEDVKWNFERVMYLCNATGSLPANQTSWEAYPSPLFYLTNSTFIFKSFEADDITNPYNFTINLNIPFGPLLDLLTFGATNILSPESTPRLRYLNLITEKLIGTGPYKYMHFKRDKEVRLERWDMYWAFPGYFEHVVFRIIEDDVLRINSGLAGQFDYICGVPNTNFSIFNTDPGIHIEDVGEDPCYYYLEFYCGPKDYDGNIIKTGSEKWQYQRINSTLRRALALAINYTNINEGILDGFGFQGAPAVSRSITGNNASVKLASDYNFTEGVKIARDLMKSMWSEALSWDSNYPGTSETEWKTNTFRNLEFNRWWTGFESSLKLKQLLFTYWDLIGIDFYITAWASWDDPEPTQPWEVDLWYIGWCPDYLNPYSIFDPLFNLESSACFSRINDTSLIEMMNNATSEINREKQMEIYKNIQSYIFDINRPENPSSYCHIPLYSYHVYQTHKNELKGINYNVKTTLECWNWYYD